MDRTMQQCGRLSPVLTPRPQGPGRDLPSSNGGSHPPFDSLSRTRLALSHRFLALQVHSLPSKVAFRDLRIKTWLRAAPSAAVTPAAPGPGVPEQMACRS